MTGKDETIMLPTFEYKFKAMPKSRNQSITNTYRIERVMIESDEKSNTIHSRNEDLEDGKIDKGEDKDVAKS